MPDSSAGGFAVISGSEFVNDQRTITYAKALGLPFTISEGCWCQNIQELAGCEAPVGYNLPSTDPAPWYDPAIPESADFAGFLTAEFEGIGSTYTRTSTEILTGGAVLGRLRPKPRELTWRGYLFGRNCCAVLYGLRWLTATLADAGGCDGCGTADLDVLYCCPQTAQDIEDDCLALAPPMGLVANDDAFRTFHRVGLTEGPTILNQRKIGCGEDCNGENCQGGSCLIEIEFTLVAGNPFMHRQTLLVCEGGQFPDCTDDCASNFVKLIDGQECDEVIEPCPEGDASCLIDTACEAPPLPVFPAFTDPCGCDVSFPTSFCCSISNDYPGEFFETVPTIEIYSGDLPLRNIEIRFVENPQERDCLELSEEPCYFCESLKIRYIPAKTTLQIDGTNKRITAICPGNNAQPAEGLTLSPFSWPVLKCMNYCVCVITDCIQDIDPNHSINIFVTPREM